MGKNQAANLLKPSIHFSKPQCWSTPPVLYFGTSWHLLFFFQWIPWSPGPQLKTYREAAVACELQKLILVQFTVHSLSFFCWQWALILIIAGAIVSSLCHPFSPTQPPSSSTVTNMTKIIDVLQLCIMYSMESYL